MNTTQTTEPKITNEPKQRGGEPRPLSDILADIVAELQAKKKDAARTGV